jgi:hypothetical protein
VQSERGRRNLRRSDRSFSREEGGHGISSALVGASSVGPGGWKSRRGRDAGRGERPGQVEEAAEGEGGGSGTVEVCDGVVRSPSARLRLLSTFEWILVSARYREGGMSCDHVNDQDLNLFVLRRKKRSGSALDEAVVADG